MRPAAGTGSLNRAPPGIRSIAPAGSFCPSASPHLAVSALPAVLLGHQLPFTENRCLLLSRSIDSLLMIYNDIRYPCQNWHG